MTAYCNKLSRFANEFSRISLYTHRIRDSSSAVGFTQIHNLALALEMQIRGIDNPEATCIWEIVCSLKAELQRVQILLRELICEHVPKVACSEAEYEPSVVKSKRI